MLYKILISFFILSSACKHSAENYELREDPGEDVDALVFCLEGGTPYLLESPQCKNARREICYIGEELEAVKVFNAVTLNFLEEFVAKSGHIRVYPSEGDYFEVTECKVSHVVSVPYRYSQDDAAAIICSGEDLYDNYVDLRYGFACQREGLSNYCFVGPRAKAQEIFTDLQSLEKCRIEL